jgi:hypothetical protein
MRGRSPAPLVVTSGWPAYELCAQSGELATPACSARTRERFRPGQAPRAACALHQRIEVDPQNGLLAGPGCAERVPRVVERYAEPYRSWARDAGRPLAPGGVSPRCPGSAVNHESDGPPSIDWPASGQRFVLDAERRAQQIVVEAKNLEQAGSVGLWVDGQRVATGERGRVAWTLVPGDHELALRNAHGSSEPVRVSVAELR